MGLIESGSSASRLTSVKLISTPVTLISTPLDVLIESGSSGVERHNALRDTVISLNYKAPNNQSFTKRTEKPKGLLGEFR